MHLNFNIRRWLRFSILKLFYCILFLFILSVILLKMLLLQYITWSGKVPLSSELPVETHIYRVYTQSNVVFFCVWIFVLSSNAWNYGIAYFRTNERYHGFRFLKCWVFVRKKAQYRLLLLSLIGLQSIIIFIDSTYYWFLSYIVHISHINL